MFGFFPKKIALKKKQNTNNYLRFQQQTVYLEKVRISTFAPLRSRGSSDAEF